jgi:predicted phage tail protein
MPKKLQIEAVIQDEETAVAKTDAQVSDLELVTNIVAGKLTSNAKEYSAALKNEIANYTIERYIDNPDAAKTDKAYLNKLKDDVAEKRKLATQTWNKPLEEFTSIMKTLEKDIDAAYGELNSIVNQAAQKEKDEKKAKIVDFWNYLNFTIVPLDRVFNPKWLNKGEKLQSIFDECKAITEKITTEMNTLKSMHDEDSETLLSFYLDTLDLNATLAKGNQLKENRAKIKAEEARKAAEYMERETEINPHRGSITIPESVVKENLTTEKQQPKEPVATFRLEVTAPASKLKALRKYIDDNGISYKKI